MDTRHIAALDQVAKNLADIPQIKRGMVWCTVCGHSERVDGGATLRGENAGWPKHCGFTMTIDSPEERAALDAKQAIPTPKATQGDSDVR